jgi:Skp family chaperone for outer membrane proteins
LSRSEKFPDLIQGKTTMNRNAWIKDIFFCASLTLVFLTAHAHSEAPAPAKPVDPKVISEEIFKKCMSGAKQLKDEQVCKARRPSIDQCVEKESKAKDAKTAKTKCELLFLPQ